MEEENLVARNFSKAASVYEEHAVVQSAIAENLLDFISQEELSSAERILEVGAGTGILSEKYLAKNPILVVDVVDSSDGMLGELKRKFSSNLGMVAKDFSELEKKNRYKLVLSSCCFHWFDDFPVLFSRLGELINPGGKLAFSIMLNGTFRELSDSVDIASNRKRVFGFPNRAKIENSLIEAGFEVSSSEVKTHFEYFKNFWEFMHSLKQRGVRTSAPSSVVDSFSPTQLRQMAINYDRAASLKVQKVAEIAGDSGVYARYQVGYFVAKSLGAAI